MDAIQGLFETFKETLETPMPNSLLLCVICLTVVVLCIWVLVFAKAREWKAGQERFVPPKFIQRAIKPRRGAEIIDFASAAQRMRNFKNLHKYSDDRALRDELHALRGKERNSLDFSHLQKGSTDDEPHDAA